MATFIAAVDITPAGTSGWQTVDVSASVPAGATGIIGRVSAASSQAVGWRMPGSTDARIGSIGIGEYTPFYIGVDGSRNISLYRANADVTYSLRGYFPTDAVFFTNATDVTPGVTGAFEDVDISALTGADTALAAILELTPAGNNIGVRNNGAAAGRYRQGQHAGAIIGVDGSEIFEARVAAAAQVYLVGYITTGVVMAVTATQVSPTGTGAWEDLSALPAGASGGIYEVESTLTTGDYGLRKNGDADGFSLRSHYNISAIECDGGLLVEGYVSATSVEFWLWGYFITLAITSITPNHSAVGDSVTIAGTNFEAAQGTGSVSFTGGGTATITSWSDTEIVCTVPTGSTSGNVTVTNDSSQSDTIAWALDPQIDNITPASGVVGINVIIDGQDFESEQGTGVVTFATGQNAAIVSWTAAQIVCQVPAAAVTGNVTVTTDAGGISDGYAWTVEAGDTGDVIEYPLNYGLVAITTAPTTTPAWTDISDYILAARIRRGRQHELNRTEAGTCEIVLNNQDNRFDPNNTTGPYYGDLVPMRRIQLYAVHPTLATVYYLFTGYVESWPPAWGDGVNPIVALKAVDAFKVFAMYKLNTTYGSAELSGVRINRVLDDIGWTAGNSWVLDSGSNSQLGTTTILAPNGDRQINDGQTTIQSTVLADTTALQHMQDVALAENGLFYMAADGIATFADRHTVYRNQQETPIIFGDALGEIHYTDIDVHYDDSEIYNDIRMKRVGGTVQTASDATSQADYWPRTLPQETLLSNSDTDMADRANAMLNRYKDPQWRAKRVSFEVDTGGNWASLLGLELGGRVRVMRRPSGLYTWQQDYIVESIDHVIGPGRKWTITFALSPATVTNGWVLAGTAGDYYSPLSVLGTTTILGY